jgi:hypothetical protein
MCRNQEGGQLIRQQQKQPKQQHGNTTGSTQRNSSKIQYSSMHQGITKPNFVHTNYLYMTCDQEKAGSSRTLFKEGQQTHEPSSTNSACISNSRTPPNQSDIIMLDATNKQQHGESSAEASKRRAAATNEEHRHNSQYHKSKLWFGFPVMEQIAKGAGHPPIDLSNINIHLANGIPQEESRLLANAKIAYLSIPQRLWPSERNDGKPSQHYHLTQIPFDARIIAETGLAKTYQLLLHFEKTRWDYSSKEILDLIASQFQKMSMELGEILEPIAPLCSAKGPKSWNGMTKVHLRNPTTNGNALLTGTRIFSLILDEELTIPKISKGYDSLTPNDLLTVTISSPNLSQMPPHEILTEIVVSSFRRGQEYEISQVHKQKEDAKAYLVGTLPEQCKKLVLHQVTVNREILQSRIASEESFTKKEI